MQTLKKIIYKKNTVKRLFIVLSCMAALLLFTGCQAKSELMLSEATDTPVQEDTAQETDGSLETEAVPESTSQEAPVKWISVHVCGAVNKAGVYEIPEDARVVDAVDAAGGLTDDAYADAVNLAAFLVDGCRLRIPYLQEHTADEAADESLSVITVGTELVPVDSLVVLSDSTVSADTRVNINTATAQELCTLNGIGEKRAADIIRFREENGAFASIEDIMKVSGIKQNLFAKIKEYIRV